MRRAAVLFVPLVSVAACSLFLDSGEFASEDDKGTPDGGPDTSTTNDAPVSDSPAADAPSTIDGGDAGDDFCTRSFANAVHFDPFDLAPTSRWSRQVYKSFASISKIDTDGKPAPAVSISTDSGIPAETFAAAWLEKDLAVGRTYRFGFDVKISSNVVNHIALARFGFDTPESGTVTDYAVSVFQGPGESAVEHRYQPKVGPTKFQYVSNIAPGSVDWVSYRVEIAIGVMPGGASRHRVCRDGVLVSEKTLDYLLDAPNVSGKPPVFAIGIVYTDDDQPPLDIRFDNAFAEVLP